MRFQTFSIRTPKITQVVNGKAHTVSRRKRMQRRTQLDNLRHNPSPIPSSCSRRRIQIRRHNRRRLAECRRRLELLLLLVMGRQKRRLRSRSRRRSLISRKRTIRARMISRMIPSRRRIGVSRRVVLRRWRLLIQRWWRSGRWMMWVVLRRGRRLLLLNVIWSLTRVMLRHVLRLLLLLLL